MTTPLRVDPAAFDPARVGFFRYGVVAGKVLLTNEGGEHCFLDFADFDLFYRGKIEAGHPRWAELRDKAFLKPDVDLERLIERVRRKKAFLTRGPHLHAVVVTLRCNQSCRYCHASRTDMDRVDTDMSLETARKVVDLAFTAPSPVLNFEFQGGEPTVNFEAIRFIVDYALEKNRYENKELIFSIVTNMTAMDDEKMGFLIDRGVMVCTSLDGPQALHDHNRGWSQKGSPYAQVVHWIDRFNETWVKRGWDPDLYRVDALMTTTRRSLDQGRAIVDEYVKRGIRSIHLRPLNPFGFALSTWKQIGYSMDEFLEFYRDTLAYVIELNRAGTFLQERQASLFLTKILTPDDPNYADCRSPCGSGSVTAAYGYDGRIYTDDEGRMLGHMGDHFFQTGHVDQSSFPDILRHPTVRALMVASIQDALPACHDCVFKPSCGIQPLHNYKFDGDIFGQRPRSRKCQEFYGQQQHLYGLLAGDEDGSLHRIFRRWTVQRARPGIVPGDAQVSK